MDGTTSNERVNRIKELGSEIMHILAAEDTDLQMAKTVLKACLYEVEVGIQASLKEITVKEALKEYFIE